MEEIQEHFYTSIHTIEYSVIKKGMLYIQKYIPNSIWNNCIELKKGGKAVDTKEDLELVRKIIISNY